MALDLENETFRMSKKTQPLENSRKLNYTNSHSIGTIICFFKIPKSGKSHKIESFSFQSIQIIDIHLLVKIITVWPQKEELHEHKYTSIFV